MDTTFEKNWLIRFNRENCNIDKIWHFNGPIYNFKKMDNDFYLIVTATEGRYKDYDNKSHVWISKDIINWKDLISYKKDFYPDIMGHGRIILPNKLENQIIFSGHGSAAQVGFDELSYQRACGTAMAKRGILIYKRNSIN